MNPQRLTRVGISAAVSSHHGNHRETVALTQPSSSSNRQVFSTPMSKLSSQQLRPFSSTPPLFQGTLSSKKPTSHQQQQVVPVGGGGGGTAPVPLSLLSSAIDSIEDLLARRPTQCGILFNNIPLSWNASDLAEFIEETLQKDQANANTPPPCYWLSKQDIQRQYKSTSSSGGGESAGPFAAEFGNDEDAFDGGNQKVKGLSPPEVAFKLSDAQLEWLSDPTETESLVQRAASNPASQKYSKAQIKGRLGALLPLLSSNPIAATTVKFSHKLGVSLGAGMIFLRDEFNPEVSLVPATASPPRDLPSHLLELKASIEESNQVLMALLKEHSPQTLGLRKPQKANEKDGGDDIRIKAMDGRFFASMQKLLEILEMFAKEIEAHMAPGTKTKPEVISHFISRVVAASNSAFIGIFNAPNIHKDSRRLLELGEVNNQQQHRQKQEEEEKSKSGGGAEGEKEGGEGQQSASQNKKKKNPWAPHNLEEFTQTPTLSVEGHDKLIGVTAFDPQSSLSRDLTDLSSILGSLQARNPTLLPTITNSNKLTDGEQHKYDVAFEDAKLAERESRVLKEATGDVESTLATLDIDRYLLSPDLLYDFRRMVQRKVVPAFELKRSLENALTQARLERDIVGALSTLGITKSSEADDDEHVERIWGALAELNEEGIDHLCRNATPHLIDHARIKLYELLAEYVVTTAKRGRWDVCSSAPANPSQPIISSKHYLELVKAALATTLTTAPSDSKGAASGGGKMSNVELKHFTSAVDPSSDVDTLRTQLGRGSRINMTSSGTPYLLHKKMR